MHPVLFTLPGLEWEVQAYGFLLGVALLLGWFVALRLADRDRLPADQLGTAYVLAVAAGLFAARAGWLVWNPDGVEGAASFAQLQAGGLMPTWGIVVALAVTWVYCGARKRRIPLFAWLDCIAPAFAIGLVLERVGALMAGSAFGKYVAPSFPLAVRYPSDSLVFAFHRSQMQGLLPAGASDSLTVHPSQLYGALAGLAAIGVAVWLRRRRSFSGQVFLGVAAFVLVALMLGEQPFRADAQASVLGPINATQIVGFGAVAVLTGVYRARRAKAKAKPDAVRQWEGGPWTPKDP